MHDLSVALETCTRDELLCEFTGNANPIIAPGAAICRMIGGELIGVNQEAFVGIHGIGGILKMETARARDDEMEQVMVTYSGPDLHGVTVILAARLNQNQILVPVDIVEVNESFKLIVIPVYFYQGLHRHSIYPLSGT